MLKFLNEHLEDFFIIPLMIGMSVLIFVQVVMRYVFSASLTWSEELARYLFVWLVYFSVSYTAKREKHIRIDAALMLFPKKLRPYIELLSEILILAFSIFIVFTAFTVVGKITASGQTSPALGLPMQYVYAAPLFGFILTSFRTLQTIIRLVKKLNEGVYEA